MLNKVPEITIFFWIIKIIATTVGETGADFLIFNMHLGLSKTSLLMTAVLAVALFLQIRLKEYIPFIYWLAVFMISIVGTLITDNLTDQYDVPLETSTVAFSVLLVATFGLWYKSEKTLSIHKIDTLKRELFYWAAILVTFALGTAAGDLFAERLDFGYAASAAMFAGMIGFVAVCHYVFKMNAVWAFWLAYILTRPFGASCGDYLSQPIENGGIGLGTMTTSAVLLAVPILWGFASMLGGVIGLLNRVED